MRRAKEPLNPAAVKAADAAVAGKTGGRPLTMGPEDAALRKEWMDAYEAAGGEVEEGGGSGGGSGSAGSLTPSNPEFPGMTKIAPPKKKVGSPKAECPGQCWAVVTYHYAINGPAKGGAVAGALVTVLSVKGEEIAHGSISAGGTYRYDGCCLDFPVKFVLHDDPAYMIDVKPKPHNTPPVPPGAIERAAQEEGGEGVLDWIWGMLQGDFNEDQSMSQITVNTVLGVIPIVDQVLDVRDIIANIIKVRAAKTTAEKVECWIVLLITAIGFIPEVGSVAKGVLKGIRKGMKDPKLLAEVLNGLGRGHAMRYLRQLRNELPSLAKKAAVKVKEAIASFTALLKKIRTLPGMPTQKIDELTKSVDEMAPEVSKGLDDAAEAMKKELDEVLQKVEKQEVPAGAGETQAVKQKAIEPSGAEDRLQHEKMKDELRRAMSKPHVDDPKLKELMDDLYRENAQVGSGSTADAVRHEMQTGEMVGGRSHAQKARDYSKALQRWLDNNPTASAGDRAAAENVLRDLQNALSGN